MPDAKIVPELYCSDLLTSLGFYVELLGFAVVYDRPEESFAFLDLEGAHIMLVESSEQTEGERVWWTGNPEKPYGRGMNLQIEVRDVDGVCQRLSDADWPLFRPMEEKWYRKQDFEVGNRQFLAQDPDGYLLRFFSDLGRRPL